MFWSTKHRYPRLFYLSERKRNVFCALNAVTLIFRIAFLQKKAFCLLNIPKNYIFFRTGTNENPFRKKKVFLLHIFLCSFVYIPINKNTSILRKFKKKTISKFKKNAITISFMKNLNFISANSSLQFITIYSCYIYVTICFLGFSWNFRIFGSE